MENGKKIVLSGIQPYGINTIGNDLDENRYWNLIEG